MKTTIIVIVSLLIGGAIGGILAIGVGAGVGAAGGLVVGTQAGACLTVETAKDQGILSAEQVDKLIADTVAKIRGKAESATKEEIKWIGSEADCAAMVAELEKTARQE